ncbi:unnamed protein product [Amoebophrya sp. A25]|nr:unnamed protein product [Amoebophrya sp. A25]|eukprot:GSA25T00015429001.1
MWGAMSQQRLEEVASQRHPSPSDEHEQKSHPGDESLPLLSSFEEKKGNESNIHRPSRSKRSYVLDKVVEQNDQPHLVAEDVPVVTTSQERNLLQVLGQELQEDTTSRSNRLVEEEALLEEEDEACLSSYNKEDGLEALLATDNRTPISITTSTAADSSARASTYGTLSMATQKLAEPIGRSELLPSDLAALECGRIALEEVEKIKNVKEISLSRSISSTSSATRLHQSPVEQVGAATPSKKFGKSKMLYHRLKASEQGMDGVGEGALAGSTSLSSPHLPASTHAEFMAGVPAQTSPVRQRSTSSIFSSASGILDYAFTALKHPAKAVADDPMLDEDEDGHSNMSAAARGAVPHGRATSGSRSHSNTTRGQPQGGDVVVPGEGDTRGEVAAKSSSTSTGIQANIGSAASRQKNFVVNSAPVIVALVSVLIFSLNSQLLQALGKTKIASKLCNLCFAHMGGLLFFPWTAWGMALRRRTKKRPSPDRAAFQNLNSTPEHKRISASADHVSSSETRNKHRTNILHEEDVLHEEDACEDNRGPSSSSTISHFPPLYQWPFWQKVTFFSLLLMLYNWLWLSAADLVPIATVTALFQANIAFCGVYETLRGQSCSAYKFWGTVACLFGAALVAVYGKEEDGPRPSPSHDSSLSTGSALDGVVPAAATSLSPSSSSTEGQGIVLAAASSGTGAGTLDGSGETSNSQTTSGGAAIVGSLFALAASLFSAVYQCVLSEMVGPERASNPVGFCVNFGFAISFCHLVVVFPGVLFASAIGFEHVEFPHHLIPGGVAFVSSCLLAFLVNVCWFYVLYAGEDPSLLSTVVALGIPLSLLLDMLFHKRFRVLVSALVICAFC